MYADSSGAIFNVTITTLKLEYVSPSPMVAVEGIQTGFLQWQSASHDVEVSIIVFDDYYFLPT